MRGACAIEKPYPTERAEKRLPAGSPALPGSSVTFMKLEFSLPLAAHSFLPQITLHPRPWTSRSQRQPQNAPFHTMDKPSPLLRQRTKSNTGFRSEADRGRVFADHPGSETLQTPIGQMRGLNPCL